MARDGGWTWKHYALFPVVAVAAFVYGTVLFFMLLAEALLFAVLRATPKLKHHPEAK